MPAITNHENASPIASHASPIHLGYLDGLRALAAIFVVLHHSTLQFEAIKLSHLGRFLFISPTYGHLAVDLFIVLSGFCLMLPISRGDGVLRGGTKAFYLKRMRRILPPYYAAVGVSLLLIFLWIGHKTGTHWDRSIPITTSGLLLHLLLLQDLRSNPQINHVLWSVSVEWRIYFLFPLLVIAFRRYGAAISTLGALVISYAFWLVLHFTRLGNIINAGSVGASPYYLGLFTMGMLACHIACSRLKTGVRKSDIQGWAVVAIAFAILVGITSVPLHGRSLSPPLHSFLMGCFSVALLIWVSLDSRSWITRMLSWRPLIFIGTFAYSLYLIHAPLIQLVWQYAIHPLKLAPTQEMIILLTLGTVVIVMMAYLFFLTFERPFLNTRRQETMVETERDSALSPAP